MESVTSYLRPQFPHSWRFLQKKAISTPSWVLQEIQREWARDPLFDTSYQLKSLSRVRLFSTPWTVAYQAPLSMGFSRQECWSGLPFPSPGDLPDPGIKPGSPALQADALPSEPPGKPPDQPYLHTALISYPAFELLSGGRHTEPVPDTWPSWSFPLIISKSSGWHLW